MTYSNICYGPELLSTLAARGSGIGIFGDGVSVQQHKFTDNAVSSLSRAWALDWAKPLVHVCSYEIVKSFADLISMLTVFPVSDELSQMYPIVCVGERYNDVCSL